jgi:hypothetical protein
MKAKAISSKLGDIIRAIPALRPLSSVQMRLLDAAEEIREAPALSPILPEMLPSAHTAPPLPHLSPIHIH